MDDVLTAALRYAARGWKVFPVHGIVEGRCTCRKRDCSSPGKHPRTRHGVKEATSEARVIKVWWGRWPVANIGVATGKPSAIVVIDLDLPQAESSLERLAELGFALPPTLTALTGAGRHLYFACDRALSNATSKLPGLDQDLPGIDLRADGGYVVGPPSIHASGTTYRWLDPEVEPARLPDWIRAPDRRQSPTPSMASTPKFTGDGTPYGLAALRDEIDRLKRAPEGGRNDQLNRSAFALSQLIAGGELDEAAARAALEHVALSIGLSSREVDATIASGLSAGAAEPRTHRGP